MEMGKDKFGFFRPNVPQMGIEHSWVRKVLGHRHSFDRSRLSFQHRHNRYRSRILGLGIECSLVRKCWLGKRIGHRSRKLLVVGKRSVVRSRLDRLGKDRFGSFHPNVLQMGS